MRRKCSRSIIASSLVGGEWRRTFFHFGHFDLISGILKSGLMCVYILPRKTFFMPKGGLGLVWKWHKRTTKMWRARSREVLAQDC